jgi:hypothetical protein
MCVFSVSVKKTDDESVLLWRARCCCAMCGVLLRVVRCAEDVSRAGMMHNRGICLRDVWNVCARLRARLFLFWA